MGKGRRLGEVELELPELGRGKVGSTLCCFVILEGSREEGDPSENGQKSFFFGLQFVGKF